MGDTPRKSMPAIAKQAELPGLSLGHLDCFCMESLGQHEHAVRHLKHRVKHD